MNFLSSCIYWIIRSLVEAILELIGPLVFFVLGLTWTFDFVKNSISLQILVLCCFFIVAADLRSFFKIKCKEWFTDQK